MPRNGPATRRELARDPVYRSVLVTQVVNKVLSRGKRTLAERIVYTALEQVQEKSGGDPVAALKRGGREHPARGRGEVAVALAVPRTRSRSRCGRAAPRRWPSAGSPRTRASAGRRRWPSAWRGRSWTRRTASARR